MHRQMSFVDCSYAKYEPSPKYRSCIFGSGRLYVVSLLRLPQANVLRRQTNNVSFAINDTGSSTSSSDVNSDVVAISRVSVSFSSR